MDLVFEVADRRSRQWSMGSGVVWISSLSALCRTLARVDDGWLGMSGKIMRMGE
jgi:hypothetical protein